MMIFVLLLVCVGVTHAIYEDQFGLHEWHMKNFGLDVTSSIFGSKGLVVSTAEGILGSVDTTSGDFHWRHSLDSHVDAMAGTMDLATLFTLSHDGRVVRAWNTARGSMMWESPLGNGVDATTKAGASPVFLEAGTRDVTVSPTGDVLVLSGNELTVLAASTGAVKAQWSSDKEAGSTVILGNFVVPASKQSSASTAVTRVVVGCKTTGKLPTTVEAFASSSCDKAAVLELDLKSYTVDVKTYGKASGAAASVHGVMTYDAAVGFGPEDMVVGVTSTEASANKVHSLMLASGSSSFEVSMAKGFDVTSSVTAVRFRGQEDGTAMVASLCSSSIDNNNPQLARSCKAVVLDVTSKSATPLVECSGVAAVISLGFGQTSSQYAGSITCSSSPTGADLEHKTVVLPDKNVIANTFTAANLGDHAMQGFRAALSHAYVNSATKEFGSRVLVMSSSGSLIMTQDNTVAWQREESLSTVQSTVTIDHTSAPDESDMVSAVDMRLEDRLAMQYKEMSTLVMGVVEDTILATPAKMFAMAASPKSIVAFFKKSAAEKTREEKDHEAADFGFDKISVAATCVKGQKTLQDAGIKVVGLNQVHGEVQWTFEPQFTAMQDYLPLDTIYRKNGNAELVYDVKLLVTRPHAQGKAPAEVALLISVTSGGKSMTFFYTLDAHTGKTTNESCGPSSVLHKYVNDVFAAPKPLSTSIENAYLLNSMSDTEVVVYNAGNAKPDEAVHYHSLDESTGVLRTYRMSAECKSTGAFTTCASTSLASVVFAADHESVVATTVPSIHDKLYSKVVVMGDDSLLLKYINPYMRVVVTARKSAGDNLSLLTVNIVDTVSAKIVYRAIHEDAEGPVHCSLVENNLVVSYWNGKAKRSELSSVALYEGMIDKHGLGPYGFSSGKHARLSESAAQPFSSFTHNLPIAMNKTFILPKPVVGLDHTVSVRGITNKQFLAAFDNGQIFMIDRRQIDPRRPVNPPLPREKSEGLMQYTPFLLLSPVACITYNETVATGKPISFTAATSNLESTGSVLVSGLDLYFARVRPSQEFDMLASDFNHPLLLLILVSMAFGTYKLRDMSRAKALKSAWQ